MYISPSYLSFSLLALLASNALGANLFRGDTRGPKTIKEGGGFKAKGFSNPEGTLFEHVDGSLKHPSRDPFISTSTDIAVSREHAGNGYLYVLDESKITGKIHDVAAEYAAAGKTYGQGREKEFSVEKEIPFAAVTQVQKKVDGQWKVLKMPTKRASEFGDEDVFAA